MIAPPYTSDVMIAALCDEYPAMRDKGFKKALADLAGLPAFSEDEDVFEVVARINLRPDAFCIDQETGDVDVFEVEVTHPLPRHKLHDYAMLVTDLHSYGISLALYVVNRYGHINRVDTFPSYLEAVFELEARHQAMGIEPIQPSIHHGPSLPHA